MKPEIKSILRFLFPETQILDAIKQEGFIAKKERKASAAENQMVAGNAMVRQSAPMAMSGIPELKGRDATTYTPSAAKVPQNQIEEKFDGLDMALRSGWVASDRNIRALCNAFKRPYVMGFDAIHPRNTLLILGAESRGKKSSVAQMGLLLKQRRVIRYGDVSSVNMALYPTSAEDSLFLSDLYKALYEQTDIVIFENLEKASYPCLNILLQLIRQGVYRLPKRYNLQNHMLVETTATLNTSTISEINANGKYFVFTSTVSQSKVVDHVGNEFAGMLNDVVALDDFSEREIEEITHMIANQLREKVQTQLRLALTVDPSANQWLCRSFLPETGVNGLLEHMDNEIFKPLVEICLQQSFAVAGNATLLFADGFCLQTQSAVYHLGEYIKRYDTVALESVKQELNGVIGLDTVKEYVLNLENNLTIQRLRAQKGLKTADLSMHMIFTGNPGTGKTTIARIVAKYLKAIGVLSSGQLREVSRADLVGQYVGHTAKQTTELINSALGGVLFIDEAYSLCRDQHDTFGLEAIDALVKGMEDHREDLVVILAGYSDEMEAFLKTNPGLRSRFPNVVEFPDYTPDEMYGIATMIAKSKGYRIDGACKDAMLDLFERKQIKGRNDSGNGRLARNIIEAAILKQSQRIAKDTTQDLELLTAQDFDLEERNNFNLEKELSVIVGQESVKNFVRAQYNMILAEEKRKKANLDVDTTQSLNMIFSGNPGTGKTTMARVIARMFHAMGLLKSGHLIETDKGGLVAEYVGQTAKKTEDVFRSALGGVLFVDEAYAIANDGSGYGQECVDTLVKLIEDYRGEIVVILAGYTKEMDEFMEANSGLESRFPLRIEFPDYTAEELFRIGKLMIDGKGFRLSPEAEPAFREAIYRLKRHATATSGNGRMVRNFLDEVIRHQSSRIAVSNVGEEEMTTILPEDIVQRTIESAPYDIEKELDKVVGLEAVKKYIRSLNARLRVQEERKKHGLKVNTTQTLHMIFTGNPGTGKTMMARTVANVLYHMGVISSNKLIETDRSGLVAGYVGQTALKTRRVIENALDGVLFIDEAYSLAQGGSNDFGQEAIDTLVKMMDDHRDRLVVILAGYNEDMQYFLEQNAGLESRFPNVIEFADYSADELLSIADKMYREQGYALDSEAIEMLKQLFDRARIQPQFGNGRFVRNVFEKSLNAQAMRLSGVESMSATELITITAADIREVLNG